MVAYEQAVCRSWLALYQAGGERFPRGGGCFTMPARGSRGRRRMAKQSAEVTIPTSGPGGQEVVLIGGAPASGKSSLAQLFVERGYERLNRDKLGGRLDDLLPRLAELLAAGRSVVLDNLYPTRESRAGAVKV